MKRIGIVTTWFERGAAYVSKQFKEVWEEENEVYIYARGGEEVVVNDPKWQAKNITHGKRYSYTKLDLINLNHFENWIITNNLDIVFFNEQHIWDPILLCKKLGVLTGSYIDYYTKETVPLFAIFDFLVCNTKRHYGVFKWHPQVFFIPWGTNQNLFNATQKKKTNIDEIIFFHSAGMNPYRKGTDFLIKAFSKVKLNNVKLIIHTQVNIFSFFPELFNVCEDLISKSKLDIINKTVSAPGLYHKGDVYVYPTRLEGIGLSIAEANSCGLPVITTNEAPMNEFIIDGENGRLINVSSKKQRKDKYYWQESYIDIDHLTFLLEEYANDTIGLEKKKLISLVYSNMNFDWKKNANKLKAVLFEIKKIKKNQEVVDKIQTYENSRSLKFYAGNLVIYDKFKKFIKFSKKSS
ncbi:MULTISPECIES: glycosyltransferase family 4 protein [unclassified Polaribacter]|uniref:glycosyltransferase family 4 protein n=1 Tax=unclassified Polaribacter TaxID=196858 RepID=UPI0011BDF11E|nr:MULTISPECIES: glycosyltransferase family 4 protein [unclassified Polaribacter]TXD54236.1 glycosyltransferase family 4 protein [Polaribacter sp. IC063]TXD57122.1 glycosyltransferase family 4 protein [Polaribacter sp. IC066]